MSIIDRARDALNAWTHGTEHEKTDAAIELAKNSAVFAAEVARLHDEFAALADEWGKTTYFSGAAARIREVIESEAGRES